LLLDPNISINFIRKCPNPKCKEQPHFIVEVPKYDNTQVLIEYRFQHDGKTKIADIAYVDMEDNDILCIFEICHTHKTKCEDRTGEWFEVNAETLIKIATNIDTFTKTIKIPCIRYDAYCDDLCNLRHLDTKVEYCQERIDDEETIIENSTKSTTVKKYEDNIKNYRDEINSIKEQIKVIESELTIEDKLERHTEVHSGWKKLEYRLIESEVEYTISKGTRNLYSIIHPTTKKTIKISDVIKHKYRKLFIDGKWHDYKCTNIHNKCSITTDIINWFHNRPIIREDLRNKLQFTSRIDEVPARPVLANTNVTDVDTPLLNQAIDAVSKTQRRKLLSQYLQSHELGELNDTDKTVFIDLLDKFYEDSNINITDIHKISIETHHPWFSKCFNVIMVDNTKQRISKSQFN
jgi:hypothetical protein